MSVHAHVIECILMLINAIVGFPEELSEGEAPRRVSTSPALGRTRGSYTESGTLRLYARSRSSRAK